MSVTGKISVRPLSDLIKDPHTNKLEPKFKYEHSSIVEVEEEAETPKIRKKRTVNIVATIKKSRSSRKEPLPGQMRIDSFYNSASKSYTIPKDERPCTSSIKTFSSARTRKKNVSPKKPKRRRRKALFSTDEDSNSYEDIKFEPRNLRKTAVKLPKPECIIDLCLDSDDDDGDEIPPQLDEKNEKTNEMDKAPNGRLTSDTGYETLLTRIDEIQGKDNKTSPEHAPLKSIGKVGNRKRKSAEIIDSKRKSLKTPISVKKPKKKKSLKINDPDESWFEPILSPTNTSITEKGILVPTSADAPVTPAISKQVASIRATRKVHTLSPIDTNTIALQKGDEKAASPTPLKRTSAKSSNIAIESKPQELKETIAEDFKSIQVNVKSAESEEFKPSALIACSFAADVINISDNEQENKIQNSRSVKRRGKTVPKTPKTETKKKPRPLPPYKIVEGTSFAVDAFRYGDIEGVTHYFLTHFHADHYIGLNRKFAHPLYMSAVTARLVRVFIPIAEEFMNELSIDTPIEIHDIQITAIDANHCPGAIMLIFKTREGRCSLHTGDFRASPDMESEPIFWNNDIHTIYLDTTYFPRKYAFCAQSESIERGLEKIKVFMEKNVGSRVLYVCGSYLIGKERFWSAIARELSLKVWVDYGRRKALNAIADENILSLIVDDPLEAHLHIIPMVHLSYFTLVDYIDKYAEHFDLLFAFRPSGWEKDSRPQYRGKVNIVGIEYSEHSSHDELRRFVQFLKPQKVISTVPVGPNDMITAKIPENWYKYDKLTGSERQFQPSITSFFKLNDAAKTPSKGIKLTKKKLVAPVKTPEAGGACVNQNTQEPVSKPSCSGQLNNMTISPLENCDNIEQTEKVEESKELKEKSNISEDDDWLT